MNSTQWHISMKSAQLLVIVYFLDTTMCLGATSERRVSKMDNNIYNIREVLDSVSEKETRKVKVNISWVFATKVYIEILRNPDAKPDSIQDAKNELLKLAKWADEEVKE